MTFKTPEFLQTKTYSAMRDRLMFEHGGNVQQGVWAAGDLKATQRAAGANMSADLAAGFGLIKATDVGNAGFYHIENDAASNQPNSTPAHATLPRLDVLVVGVLDTTDGGDASDAGTVNWITGTPTAGTTLDNRNGAPTLPASCIPICDVLIPAAATTITTANIRDRRPWARGVNFMGVRSAGDITVNPAGFGDLDATAFNRRFEFSNNNPVEIKLISSQMTHTVSSGRIITALLASGLSAYIPAGGLTYWFEHKYPAGTTPILLQDTWLWLPGGPVGSYLIQPQAWNADGGTAVITASATRPLYYSVREIVAQNGSNS